MPNLSKLRELLLSFSSVIGVGIDLSKGLVTADLDILSPKYQRECKDLEALVNKYPTTIIFHPVLGRP